MEQEIYHIKTGGFEGPFSLLLDLIEKRKLHVNDVSLAAVTEDYLAYLQKIGGFPPAAVSSFVLVASTLLLIKSKSLLPDLSLTTEEQGDIKSLEERLRLYDLFTRQSERVKKVFGKRIIFFPLERKSSILVFLPDERITKDRMMELARGVLDSLPKKISMPEVEVKKVVSIEEMIEKLTDRIQNTLKISFRDLHGKRGQIKTKEDKVLVIVGFLAMLELVREGLIDAMQESRAGDILIEKRELILETDGEK